MNSGSGLSSVRKSPCSLQYRSTRPTSSLVLPVRSKKLVVSWSTGKKPQVAPYSGAILAMVARSGRVIWLSPEPKNSTNLSTTPFLRSICVIVRVRSVAVTPSRNFP